MGGQIARKRASTSDRGQLHDISGAVEKHSHTRGIDRSIPGRCGANVSGEVGLSVAHNIDKGRHSRRRHPKSHS